VTAGHREAVHGASGTDDEQFDERATLIDVRALSEGLRGQPKTGASICGATDVGLVAGGEDEFIVAWGRGNAALQSKERSLLVAWAACGMLVVLVGVLVWWGRKERTTVFVRDSLTGRLVQADAEAFFRAGEKRVTEEFTAFVREWVIDCFTWTPVDVEDRLSACLRRVDKKAHPLVRAGLRLDERSKQTELGVSGGVFDEGEKEPQAVILRTEPLEVMVSIQTYVVDRAGRQTDTGPLIIKAIVREMPRSPRNGYGLLIVDARVSEKL
jgi:hypothetical protein